MLMASNLVKSISRDRRRITKFLLGIFLLLLFTLLPPLPPAVDPFGNVIELSEAGQRAIGLFLLAGVWWVGEVIAIGATALTIGFMQPVLGIRSAERAYAGFGSTAVLFILGSVLLGIAFSKTGLTKRIAYRTLMLTGDSTAKILLGVFIITAFLTQFTAHTAVAAMMFPVLVIVSEMYGENLRPTRFGKALFIGMAFTAGAGSMITWLGGARNMIAVELLAKFAEFHPELAIPKITFFGWAKIAAPLGWLLVFIFWGLLMVMYKPEREAIPGLREKAAAMYKELGPITPQEKFLVAVIAASMMVILMRIYPPSVVMVAVGVVLFVTKILDVHDLEKNVPWNILLLFGGAISIGYALWESGAAKWMAVHFLVLFKDSHWAIFFTAVVFLMILMTNFIMNVAAIAIVLPIALEMSTYLQVNPLLITYASAFAAALPLLLLIGAAPNAIAYESRQFQQSEFFRAGVVGSVISIVLIVLFALTIWRVLGLHPVA
jgi:sodium-dependent dicarboxylate transporter 2/3/5